jgi:hypothetical protein
MEDRQTAMEEREALDTPISRGCHSVQNMEREELQDNIITFRPAEGHAP